ncbi:10160_t:CDS:2, partial [Ambispora leptoticha]
DWNNGTRVPCNAFAETTAGNGNADLLQITKYFPITLHKKFSKREYNKEDQGKFPRNRYDSRRWVKNPEKTGYHTDQPKYQNPAYNRFIDRQVKRSITNLPLPKSHIETHKNFRPKYNPSAHKNTFKKFDNKRKFAPYSTNKFDKFKERRDKLSKLECTQCGSTYHTAQNCPVKPMEMDHTEKARYKEYKEYQKFRKEMNSLEQQTKDLTIEDHEEDQYF